MGKNTREERRHYVYRHIRNDTGQPFYIGVGTKPKKFCPSTEYERAFAKTDRSDYWKKIVTKAGYTVEILMEDLTFDEAEAKEIEFIALYGRSNLGTGILCNLTDGGGGRKNYVTSDKTKSLLREINLIPIEELLDSNSFPCPITGCHHWAGMEVRGKAYLCNEGKCYPAHKFIYEYVNKTKLKKGEFVVRTCNNNFCVNPDHFRIGGYKDVNKKGKARIYKHHRQVLTKEIVIRARELKRDFNYSSKKISEILGCSYTAIRQAVSGKSWAWLNG